MSKFSSQLKKIRIATGKKQKEAAEYLGIKVRSYQAYEAGDREPNIDGLIALADFFDVSLDYLTGHRDEP